MTKKIGPEQQAHLKALDKARINLAEARAAEDEALRCVHGLIRGGFDKNISGIKLAQASGMSLPRVYQIRGEPKNSDTQVDGHNLRSCAPA